jgi:anti-sigma factor RsiW
VSAREITCQELVELVTDYFEDALSEPDRVRFERHLAECPHCVAYLDQMRQVIRAVGALREESIPPRAREDLLHAFRKWKTSRDPAR